MVPNERLYACSYLGIIVTICLTAIVSKILALFYQKVYAKSCDLVTPRVVKCSAHNVIDFFGPNQKSLSLKMANLINATFCDITLPEMY